MLAVETRYGPSVFYIVLLMIYVAYGCKINVFAKLQQLAPQVLLPAMMDAGGTLALPECTVWC